MTRDIFKIQRPLMGPPIALVYNEDRSLEAQVPFDGDLRWLFEREGFPMKMYVEAELDSEGMILMDDTSKVLEEEPEW